MEREKLLKLENTRDNLYLLIEAYGLNYKTLMEMIGYSKSMAIKCTTRSDSKHNRKIGRFAWQTLLYKLSELEKPYEGDYNDEMAVINIFKSGNING